MRIVTRRKGESVLIGHNFEIKVKVIEIRGGRVKICFEANKDIPILAEENVNRRKEGGGFTLGAENNSQLIGYK
jgi:carbon storage regulator CsrA